MSKAHARLGRPSLRLRSGFIPVHLPLRWEMTASKKKVPWEKASPKKTKHTKLNAADKKKAKASAKKAGRPYPNLVDNMKVAKEKK
jgi:hypothetical protein